MSVVETLLVVVAVWIVIAIVVGFGLGAILGRLSK